jgi:hypothetical protein
MDHPRRSPKRRLVPVPWTLADLRRAEVVAAGLGFAHVGDWLASLVEDALGGNTTRDQARLTALAEIGRRFYADGIAEGRADRDGAGARAGLRLVG